MNIQELAQWIESHGFNTNIVGTSIEIEIPWIGSDGQTGVFIEVVTNYKEAKIALGY